MSEIPDMRDVASYLGADEAIIQRWKDEGLIQPRPLPEGTRLCRVTREDLGRMAAEGTLYGSFPKSVAEAALRAAAEERSE